MEILVSDVPNVNTNSQTLNIKDDVESVRESDLYQEALYWRGEGWSVFPLGFDKKPLVAWSEYQARRPYEWEIAHWFKRFRGKIGGLAVVLGTISVRMKSSALAVRDFDTMDAYREWADAHPELAATLPTAKTSRGTHVYVRLCDERFVKFRDGELRASRKQYVVLAPSAHPSGKRYEWVNRPATAADIPLMTLKATGFMDGEPVRKSVHHERKSADTTQPPVPPSSADVSKLPPAVARAVHESLPTGPGERNARVFDLARRLKGIDPSRDADGWADAVAAWFRLALPFIATKEWGVSWEDFVTAYGNVNAADASKSRVLSAMRDAANNFLHTTARQRLLSAFRAAFRATDGGIVYLASRLAAELAGVSQMQARRQLSNLVRDGFVVVTEKGKPSKNERHGSTKYAPGARLAAMLPRTLSLASVATHRSQPQAEPEPMANPELPIPFTVNGIVAVESSPTPKEPSAVEPSATVVRDNGAGEGEEGPTALIVTPRGCLMAVEPTPGAPLPDGYRTDPVPFSTLSRTPREPIAPPELMERIRKAGGSVVLSDISIVVTAPEAVACSLWLLILRSGGMPFARWLSESKGGA